MPWVEIQEAHDEVDADGRDGGDNHVGEDVVAEFDLGTWILECLYHDEERGEGRVCHDETIHNHARQVHLLRALWSITHTENELHTDEQYTSVS